LQGILYGGMRHGGTLEKEGAMMPVNAAQRVCLGDRLAWPALAIRC
jgi:hypothetical protein